MNITVPGMSCGPCARAVTNAVKSVDPAAEVEIDLGTKRVAIDTGSDAEQVKAAIEQAGYKVEA
ncbi:MAG TPA: heavy-metal-associated domain-containing protein [Reyranellaceae bacterium]|nr:heavy-metal-associated domain-containing protein [Reyranellaceae bacterium]